MCDEVRRSLKIDRNLKTIASLTAEGVPEAAKLTEFDVRIIFAALKTVSSKDLETNNRLVRLRGIIARFQPSARKESNALHS